MQMYLAPLITLLGLLIYFFADKDKPRPKLTRVGEVMLFCGLLATLLRLDAHSFRIN